MEEYEYDPITDLLNYMDDGSDYDDGRDGYLVTDLISEHESSTDVVYTQVYEVRFDHYPRTGGEAYTAQKWRVTVEELYPE